MFDIFNQVYILKIYCMRMLIFQGIHTHFKGSQINHGAVLLCKNWWFLGADIYGGNGLAVARGLSHVMHCVWAARPVTFMTVLLQHTKNHISGDHDPYLGILQIYRTCVL